MDKKKLGIFLREARNKKYYSVNLVAEALGLSSSAIRSYEIGRRIPALNILYALCELYELDINKLIKSIIVI